MIVPLVAALTLTACHGQQDAVTGGSPSTQVKAGDHDNGRTITLHRHDRLVVRLNSTYWTFGAIPKPGVLHQDGTPQVAAVPMGTGPGHCMPGMGCGTVTVTYDATGPGQVVVAAHRTVCGEAARCVGAMGSYRLTVKVS